MINDSEKLYSLCWSIRPCGSPRHRRWSWRRRETAPRHSTVFYDPGKIWPANKDFDSTACTACRLLPIRLFYPSCKHTYHATLFPNRYCWLAAFRTIQTAIKEDGWVTWLANNWQTFWTRHRGISLFISLKLDWSCNYLKPSLHLGRKNKIIKESGTSSETRSPVHFVSRWMLPQTFLSVSSQHLATLRVPQAKLAEIKLRSTAEFFGVGALVPNLHFPSSHFHESRAAAISTLAFIHDFH